MKRLMGPSDCRCATKARVSVTGSASPWLQTTASPARIKADQSSTSTLLQTIIGFLPLADALRFCIGGCGSYTSDPREQPARLQLVCQEASLRESEIVG